MEIDDSDNANMSDAVNAYTQSSYRSKRKGKTDSRDVEKLIQKCHQVLNKVFGHSEYKGRQKDIIEAAVSAKDVLVIAPTGLGKSLCFQIPAISVERGLTIVISPLLALIKNQVSRLTDLQIPVVAMTSETSPEERQKVINDMRSGHPTYRLIYVTPEKLCSSEFAELLDAVHKTNQLNRLVVDEAHCISEWGHDFRTEYRRLGTFRDRYPDVPIMALTASATKHVQEDIVQSLKMLSENTFRAIHPFNRPNLFYEVRYISGSSSCAGQMDDIREFISTLHKRRGKPSCGIIYCRLRNTCNELASYLRGKGINARPYHKGLKPAILDRTMEQWQQGNSEYEGGVDVVVATIAFGCGIDKSDVRYVIHFDLPKSLEGYYQETGRAGRDGSPARCVLYYSREDAFKVKKLVATSFKSRQVKALLHDGPEPTQRTLDSLTSLLNLAESTFTCRHVAICKYFGEATNANASDYCNKMCDICKCPEKTRERHKELSSDELLTMLLSGSVSEEVIDSADDCSIMQRKGKINDGVLSKQNQEKKQLAVENRPLLKKTALGPASKGQQSTTRLVDTLKKPFKTPFKDITSLCSSNSPKRRDLETIEVSDEVIVIDDESIQSITSPKEVETIDLVSHENLNTETVDDSLVWRKSSPLVVEQFEDTEEEVKLEAPYSQKVPVAARTKGFTSIRKTLYNIFGTLDQAHLEELLNVKNINESLKSNALTAFSKELEFGLYAYSATEKGYQERLESQLPYLKVLTESRLWWDRYTPADEDEVEALFYLKTIRGVAQRLRDIHE